MRRMDVNPYESPAPVVVRGRTRRFIGNGIVGLAVLLIARVAWMAFTWTNLTHTERNRIAVLAGIGAVIFLVGNGLIYSSKRAALLNHS